MHYLFGFLCVCALGLMPLVGCSETSGDGGNGGDGGSGATCEGNVCPCSEAGIRAAIEAGGDDPYTFDCDGPTPLAATFRIDNDVILDGEGQLIVDSFDVAGGVTAALRAFEMTDQWVWADGSGIWNDGTLKITDSSIHGFSGVGISNVGTLELVNSSVSGNLWGGVSNHGTLTITDSIISGNRTGDLVGGGAGIKNRGTLTIADSTISDNFAWYGDLFGGGGIYNSGSATISTSTVSRNEDTSDHGGGAIQNDGGLVTVTNSTIAENEARGPGGAFLNSGTLMIINSTVSANTAEEGSPIHNNATAITKNSVIEGSCSGSTPLESGGYNIESPGDTCGFDPDGTDQVNVSADDLNLGELANNGGPTMTHALLPGSPPDVPASVAIDAIPAVACQVDKDQRGEPRPVGDGCDVGSFERQPED